MQHDLIDALAQLHHHVDQIAPWQILLATRFFEFLSRMRRPHLASLPKPEPLSVDRSYYDPLKMNISR